MNIIKSVSKNLNAIIAIALLVSISQYVIGQENLRFEKWRYSFSYSPEYYLESFDDMEWTYTSLPLFLDTTPRALYLRGEFIVLPESKNVIVTFGADDCIKEIYVNGKNAFYEGNCGGCTHCDGKEFDITPFVHIGRNLISVEIINNNGPMSFNIGSVRNIKIAGKSLFDTYIKIFLPILFAIVIILLFYKILKNSPAIKSFLPIFFVIIISSLFFISIYKNFDYWGIRDWDYHQFINAVPRQTILEYGQIPLWNPYQCGGNVMLANPQSGFLSPFFIFIILFGEVVGLKINIIIHMMIGMLGSYYLARHLKFGDIASYFPPIIFMMSSIYQLQLAEGHMTWIAMSWIPWVFLYYLKSIEKLRYVIISGLFISMMFFEGNVYIFAYSILLLSIYGFLRTIQSLSIRPITAIILIIIIILPFSAIKLLPVLEVSIENPRSIDDSSGFTLEILYNSFLNRIQKLGAHYFNGQVWGWHEYGAYIGDIVALLSLYGIVLFFRKEWPIIITTFMFLIFIFNYNSPINLWALIHSLPLYESLRNPSRMVLMAVFGISILSGMALSDIEKRNKYLALAIVLFVLFDLYMVNSSIMENTFVIEPMKIEKDSDFHQVFGEGLGYGRYSSMYEVFLKNHGEVGCYEPQHIKISAITMTNRSILNPRYMGETFLNRGNGTAKITYFSPNRIEVDVDTLDNDILILNQNYHSGWNSNIGNVISVNGLVAVPVKSGKTHVVFYYLPKSFVYGAIITLISLFVSLIIIIKLWRRSVYSS